MHQPRSRCRSGTVKRTLIGLDPGNILLAKGIRMGDESEDGTRHVTRQARRGYRADSPSMYDMKYHPDFDRNRRTRAALRHSKSRDDESEEEDEAIYLSGDDSQSENEYGAESEGPTTPPPTTRALDPKATRRSERTAATRYVEYRKTHHPQDSALRVHHKRVFPPDASHTVKKSKKRRVSISSNDRPTSESSDTILVASEALAEDEEEDDGHDDRNDGDEEDDDGMEDSGSVQGVSKADADRRKVISTSSQSSSISSRSRNDDGETGAQQEANDDSAVDELPSQLPYRAQRDVSDSDSEDGHQARQLTSDPRTFEQMYIEDDSQPRQRRSTSAAQEEQEQSEAEDDIDPLEDLERLAGIDIDQLLGTMATSSDRVEDAGNREDHMAPIPERQQLQPSRSVRVPEKVAPRWSQRKETDTDKENKPVGRAIAKLVDIRSSSNLEVNLTRRGKSRLKACCELPRDKDSRNI
ncbi:hypothetical protein H2203_002902 [Taxawa tesnikishii (nom. ined.)]|nr:hypothetical protein H2203_002902 [Dothideales sp. JES 119]